MASPVRREDSSSIESLVWLLTRELAALGHDVTVFGAAGSKVSGTFVSTLPGPYGAEGSLDDWQMCEWLNLCQAVARSREFDVLHSHAYLWGLPLDELAQAPMIHTLHVQPESDAVKIRSMYPRARVTSLSHYQWSAFPELPPTTVIYHAVDASMFHLRRDPGDYLLYLGRFTPGKGAAHAVEAAQKLGMRIILAGPPSAYYQERIAPLVDGRTVVYAGYVTGLERSRLLGGARALLCPFRYPEPFGLVMVEAMMCGTPVAAIGLGAVPEIVDSGVTGYFCDAPEGLAQTVEKATTLDRSGVRARAELRFVAERMAREYARVDESVISRDGSRAHPDT